MEYNEKSKLGIAECLSDVPIFFLISAPCPFKEIVTIPLDITVVHTNKSIILKLPLLFS